MKKFLIILFTTLIITTSLILYSRFISTSGVQTHEIKIQANIDNGLKIVHFSDIHYGRTINKKELDKIVIEINNNKPDVVVFTGDLFDKDITLTDEDIKNITGSLKNIDAPLGKFIISGDNDIFDTWDKIVNDSNFINLDNTYKLIFDKTNTPIVISGISSNLNSDTTIKNKTEKFTEYYSNTTDKPVYSILLMHEPDYIDELDLKNYNLVLAGHTLGGQFRLPFIGPLFFRDGYKKYYEDYYNIDNTDIYISNGLGTINNNFRFNSKPSINFYRIVK